MLNSFIELSNRSKRYTTAGYTKRRCDEIKDHVTGFVQLFGSKIQDNFIPFSRLLQVSKIAGQISKLFQEFKTLYEP